MRDARLGAGRKGKRQGSFEKTLPRSRRWPVSSLSFAPEQFADVDNVFCGETDRDSRQTNRVNLESQDTCCTFVPYFKIHEGKLNEARALCDKFVEKTREEAKVMFYGFTFDADHVHCREGYQDADGVLAHLENVGELFKEALKIADLTRLEVHGREREVEKLRGPLAELKPQFFTLRDGFRRS